MPSGHSEGIPAVKIYEHKSTADVTVNESAMSGISATPTQVEPGALLGWTRKVMSTCKDSVGWVGRNSTWSKIKPVIRCSVSAWISAVLFIIPPVHNFMGSAAFLILIASFLSPPSDPFISINEREVLILGHIGIGLAWASLGIFVASLSRKVHDPTVTIVQAATGQYMETAPAVIMGIWMFFGTTFFLYIKARQGPGPYAFACFSACLCLDICLTTSVLFPFPYYTIVRNTALPYIIHSIVSVVIAPFVFPASISTVYKGALHDVISTVMKALDLHQVLLHSSVTSSSFGETLKALRSETQKCEASLVPVAASSRLLKSDLTYARFAPTDYKSFQALCRRLSGKVNGLVGYFALIDPQRERVWAPATGFATPSSPVSHTPRTPLTRVSSRVMPHTPLERTDTPEEKHQKSPRRRTRPSLFGHSRSGSLTESDLPLSSPIRHHPPSPSHTLHAHFAPNKQLSHSHDHPHHHRPLRLLHNSLLSLAKSSSRSEETAVGVFEMQRYLGLELDRLHDPEEELHTDQIMELLMECSSPVLKASHSGLNEVIDWLANVHSGRISHLRNVIILAILGKKWGKRAQDSEDLKRKLKDDQKAQLKKARDELQIALDNFRDDTRHQVLDPYRDVFEDARPHRTPSSAQTPAPEMSHEGTIHEGHQFVRHDSLDSDEHDHRYWTHREFEDPKSTPPHRYLFNSYVYQYHLMRLSSIVIEMLDEVLRLEEERPWPTFHLWTPVERLFRWNDEVMPDEEPTNEDDNPDVIQGLQPPSSQPPRTHISSPEDPRPFEADIHVGPSGARNPYALPPRNGFEWMFSLVHDFILGLGGGNFVFAVKGGFLAVLMSLPSFINTTAPFAYQNRFVWGIFMSQLTLNRFRGDTLFELVVRLSVTFGGGCTGMAVWYISNGNPYGLAATCAVFFPFFYFARLYWPIPPMTKAIFFVTTSLVIGYSYQYERTELPGLPGTGWSVAWRRFVLVCAGTTAASIVSFLPPSTTIRGYQPHLLSTTSSKIGSLYCSIISYASAKDKYDIQSVDYGLIAVRSKLKKATLQRGRITYEMSLSGRWPVLRYAKIAELQMSIAYSLSHLTSIIVHMEPGWTRAFLRRTRFVDPDFQGDVLAVISMISASLRTCEPLPQITPCPLLDRFMGQYQGLSLAHKDAEEDYGIPRTLTMKTLRNEQYLMFCVAVSTVYTILHNLDKLMIAVKEVVGEQYHIHGIQIRKKRKPYTHGDRIHGHW